MNGPVLLLCLLSLALLGSLPLVFFRAGRITRGWWLTATPFFCNAVLVLLALGGRITPLDAPTAFAYLAVPFIAAAFMLIGMTLGTHARPVSMWHQEDDPPESIVRHGAYRHIRHPFYASFILMLIGIVLALPHALTVLLLVWGAAQLDRTAAREEMRLLATSFGGEYADYMSVSGRFMPRLQVLRRAINRPGAVAGRRAAPGRPASLSPAPRSRAS